LILASEVPQELRVRAGALELHCLVWGREGDPSVLLVHGSGGHAHWWDVLVPALLPGRRLVAVDTRGHGESSWPETADYRIESLCADLVAVLEALAPGPVPVIGHSMGGRAVAWLTARHPEWVRSAAILDSRVRGIGDPSQRRWLARVQGRRSGRAYPTRKAALAAFRLVPPEPGVPQAVLDELAHHAIAERAPGQWTFRFDRAVLGNQGDGAGDLLPELARIRVPFWIARGEGSSVLTAQEEAELRAALPGARLASLPGAHHFFLSHPKPAAFWLLEFLAHGS
jgi:pimeloyl-ACP methyl ester carboxylesterase